MCGELKREDERKNECVGGNFGVKVRRRRRRLEGGTVHVSGEGLVGRFAEWVGQGSGWMTWWVGGSFREDGCVM